MADDARPWWQQATALVTVSASGVITGLSFVPGTAAAVTAPSAVPLHLLALSQAGRPAADGPTAGDAQVRAAIVNVARYYLQLARSSTPAQVEAMIWGKVSSDGADHGPSCAAFTSLALELAAQAAGHQSWATGGTSYPWALPGWADVRVDTNPASPAVTSMQADAQAHGRWHPLGDAYTPQPGDFALYDGHVEVVVSYAGGTLTTIGADSLPDLTVNEHSSSAPLADQGIAGFIDNGNLPLAAGTQPAVADPSATASAPRDATAQAPAAESAAGPGAEVPGLPAAAAFTSAGGIPGAGQGAPRTESAGRAASVPGLVTVSGSPGTTLSRGAAVIPGTSPSPPAPVTAPAAPKAAAPAATPRAAAPPQGAASAATPAQQAFINAVAPGAVAAQQQYGVPASVTIAQAIEESGWGQSSLAATYHNLFGIKGSGPAGSVTLPTQEYENGQWVTTNAAFAAYHDDAESITGHASLLATSGYYAKAMAARTSPDAFANDLTGVYATDPGYGANLIALMRTYNLYQYNTTPAPAAAAVAAVTVTPAPESTPRAARAVTTASSTPVRAAGKTAVPGPAVPALAIAGTGAGLAAARRRKAARYGEPLPQATLTALFATARGPMSRGEHLYRDVAAGTGTSWELLAAVDWMQCRADPRCSPAYGEKLGTRNGDGTCYPVKSAALARCACDLTALAAAVYGIDITKPALPVRELAAAFAAFRWGALLKRHQVSPMEFPYSVAGLTAAHQKMRWPPVEEPGAPDKPGSRFREPFGAVPLVLSLGYPATVN